MKHRVRTDPVTGVVVEDPQVREFAAILLELDKGRLHEDLSEGLWDLTQAVETLKKKGSLTLSLTVEPSGKADGAPLQISGEVKVSAPRPSVKPTVMFVGEDGNVTTRNPFQPELTGLRVVDEQTNSNIRSI